MRKMLKAIITEDGSETSHELAGILRSNGFEVSTVVKDGTKLVEKLNAGERPDVLLMDGFMPRLDALGVLRAIDSMHLEKRPIVMVLSSTDNQMFESEILNSGADYYFLKPYDPKMLAERIVQFSDIHSSDLNRRGVKDLEVVVSQIMHQIGVPAHIRGYQYLREAIILSVKNNEMISSVTKILYPTVAKTFKTTPSRVERAIRHAIEVAWDRGDVDVLSSYFGYTIQNERGKPTNSEFIAMISDNLKLRMKAV
ncbi:MAG: sporulation transcription factor Spo0A [Oscillospiraceae bacterium]|nr:sporulation transcription factor Spo0A [Clostridiaceae bacterium]MDO4496009.1 sporulation transcription factor Spo0A [Clostridiaceae bacterium]MDY5948847.1 sporulation transcription factor Spo0A [Oscillospiraceae bacterium]